MILVREGFSVVMPGVLSQAYVPGIHVLRWATRKTWMAGTSSATTD